MAVFQKKATADPPAPGPEPQRALLGVGDELAGLSSELTRALSEDWHWSWSGSQGSALPKAHETYHRYGQRLRELQVEPVRAFERVQREIDGLLEKTVRDSHSRLAWLGARIWQLLDSEIPDRLRHQGEVKEKVAGVQLLKNKQTPFYWHRFWFMLLPAIALLAAEAALGEDITKTALRLSGDLWMLFPAALLSLPLIFKELLEWEGRSVFYRRYLLVLTFVVVAALIPLTLLRSDQAMRLMLPSRGAPIVASPFTSSTAVPTAAPGAGGADQAPPGAAPAKDARPSWALKLTFLFLGLLFPMLSGLAFWRALEMADGRSEIRKCDRQLELLHKEVEAADAKLSGHRLELVGYQQETVKLVEGLGDSNGFAEKVLAELVAVVQSVNEKAAAELIGRIDVLQPQGLRELSKRLAIEAGRLAGGRDPSSALKLKHYTDLLASLAQIEAGKSLEKLAMSKKDIVCASIREGYESLHNVAFAVVRPYRPEEKAQMVEDRAFYDALFRRRRQEEAS
ncbi:MAG TPA: hypothetical protein DD490_16250 [Acidobacteria bacterium]|nr:hypothetical protein [Acidobacteriota bacterium]